MGLGASARIEADYLVVGAGAMGMAFADVLVAESDATCVIVDRHGRPGGHWNDAYPHVRLHQPSAFYGVNSLHLGTDRVDDGGSNAGLYELASGSEVVSYFGQVMDRQLLASGRVTYLPMCHHDGDGRVRSLVSDRSWQVDAATIVDATYMNVTVPAQRPPTFDVDPAARCVPPNDLSLSVAPPDAFTVVGAGKTGMDACLWLLEVGVDPGAITWVVPRDSWCLDRANLQPGPEFLDRTIRTVADTTEIAATAETIDDLFERLEEVGALLRVDPSVTPTMYRCATLTTPEMAELRRIGSVVRAGRVRRIGTDEIVLDGGSVPTTPATVHVDCAADGLERRPPVPVFDGDRITLQSVRTCQQVFSAAFIAHVALSDRDETERNELCTPVPHPDTHLDWLRTTVANTANLARWRRDPEITDWLTRARLDGFTRPRSAPPMTPDQASQMARIREATPASVTNLTRLIAAAET